MIRTYSRRAPARARTILAVASGLVLLGCGGGGGGSNTTLPATPQSLVAFPGDSENVLTWAPAAGATTYTLYWDTSPGVALASATPIPGVTPPFYHQGLTNGQDYYYVVTASNGAGEGIGSAEAWGRPRQPLGQYDPPWAAAVPSQVIPLDYDPQKTPAENATDLLAAIAALMPGDRLELSTGTWVVDSFFSIDLWGTGTAPIWIAARLGERPVLTRSDAQQAVLTLGGIGGARYLALEGIEITGGDDGLALHDAQEVWVNLCRVHDTGHVGIAAETFDTANLYLTRNQVDSTGDNGTGILLGGVNDLFPSAGSIVAMNQVFDCTGFGASGIHVRQGTYGTIVAENNVHDTTFPCILVLGTGTMPWNTVERNVCYNSSDNVIEVQSQAWVRNNLMLNGFQGFSSKDGPGVVQDVEFVHNTIINTGRGANLSGWDNRPGLVFANNVVYSQVHQAVRFGNGSLGVTLSGNVFVGPLIGYSGGPASWTQGTGMADFAGATWNGTGRDVTPTPGGPIADSGDALWETPYDVNGTPRSGPTVEAGAVDLP